STSSSRRRSAAMTTTRACGAASRICSRVCDRASPLRATRASPAAPWRANSMASWRPSPRDAPVIRAYFPESLLMSRTSSFSPARLRDALQRDPIGAAAISADDVFLPLHRHVVSQRLLEHLALRPAEALALGRRDADRAVVLDQHV